MNDNPVSPADYYRAVRGQIEHEDNLISQRLNWFLMSQSFLFTAYAIVVTNSAPRAPAEHASGPKLSLLVLIPVVAVCTSVLIHATIVACVLAMRNLRRLFRAQAAPAKDFDLPPIQGQRNTRWLGQAPPLLLPLLFTGVWLFLLAVGFY